MAEHGKDPSSRAELRERIVETAMNAFTSHGIKSITMDDIAASLGISKRTLYEVFSDKESLLKEGILRYKRIGSDIFKKSMKHRTMYLR